MSWAVEAREPWQGFGLGRRMHCREMLEGGKIRYFVRLAEKGEGWRKARSIEAAGAGAYGA